MPYKGRGEREGTKIKRKDSTGNGRGRSGRRGARRRRMKRGKEREEGKSLKKQKCKETCTVKNKRRRERCKTK